MMLGCCSQRCQSLPQNWHRPGWMTVLLLMSVSFLLFPVFKSVLFHLHAAVTGGYVSGTHSLAFINCPNEQIAKDIARGILEKRLAASVNVMPRSSSLYIWKEEIEESSEMMKTRTAMIEELAEYVRFVHPFETPDFLTVPIDKGNPAYFRWMEEVLS
ncbi:protein CutA homolog isoform X2 [Hyperolius riggenbachi]|uniref:protein CutA homolog isoform X2 n=1 Tax=Hyperolius riggenbachi TaxID=752182 RepID=UPI0035A32C32